MVSRAEKEPALKEYPGLTRAIEYVDEATRGRLKEKVEVSELTPSDIKIVSGDDFFELQRELLLSPSLLHKDARYFYYKTLDRAYGKRFPLIPEGGFLIDPETRKLFVSRAHIDEVREVSKDETSFLLHYGSLLCRENLRRSVPSHTSEEPLLAFFGLESLTKYILNLANFIEEESPKEAKRVKSQASKLKEDFDRVLTEAQWKNLRVQIEGAKIAVFLKNKLLLRTGFWIDRQVAEIVSHKIRLAFVQIVGIEKKVARRYMDDFEMIRRDVGQEFGLPLEKTKRNLRKVGLGTGARLFEAYLAGEIPLAFAQNFYFYHHPEFFI